MGTWLAGIGSVIGALLASACCIGPLLAVGLCIGSLGAATALEAYRTYFLGGAAACLGLGYYFTYRKYVPCDTDEACETSVRPEIQKVALWIATVLTAGFAAFPYFL
jgi:mercuric ion transport protein